MPAVRPVERLLDLFHARKPIRSWSLIVTLYGDAIVPRGGELWLGTLLPIMAAFRIDEGPVRTAMSRLAQDGWLERRKLGRKSYYRLSRQGRADFAAATDRIYFGHPRSWSGRWRLVLLPENGDGRPAQRERLRAAGFGDLAPGLLVAPSDSASAQLPKGNDGGIILLEAAGLADDARAIAARAWDLQPLADAYRRFLASFEPLDRSLDTRGPPDDLQSLVLRTLLIHEYRRLVLRDPLLPAELLAPDWPGGAARRLCAGLYRRLVAASEAWLDAHAVNATGALPPPNAEFGKRFTDET